MNRLTGRWIAALWGLVLLCSMPLIAAASDLDLSISEQQWIAANPTLIVGNETDWPPFDFAVNAQAKGYSIDLIQMIAEKAGLSVTFVTGPHWDTLLKQLRNGAIDVLPAIYTSEDRQTFLDFSSPYFSQPSVIVVKKTNESINGFAALYGEKVAAVRGFAITEVLLRDHPEIDVKVYDSVVDCLKAVSLGAVTAYIDSIGLIAFNLENNFIPNLKIIGDVEEAGLANPPLHIGVSKGNTTLLSIINKSLSAITPAEREFLRKKWLATSNYEKRLTFTTEQTRWIRKNPTVRVGLDPDYPPYSFIDENGDYAGIAVDMLELISEKTSLKFVPASGISWQQLLDGIRDKTLDMGAPVVQNLQRDEYMIFSPPFISAPLVIMTRIDDNDIQSAGDLAHRKVAIVEGYNSSQRVIDDNPDIIKHWVKTPLEALQAVSTGSADAFVGVIGVNIFLSQKHGMNNLQVAGDYALNYDGQRFAIRSDLPELAVLLTKALDSISAEQRTTIHNRWIKIPDTRRIDYSTIWKALAVCLIIVISLYIHNRRLSSEILQRKQIQRKLVDINLALEQAKRTADDANRGKSKFVTTISHELKTPLNAIVGFSDLLRCDTSLSPDAHENVELIHDAGKHLNRVLADLLDLSMIETGKLHLQNQPTDLVPVIKQSIELSRINASNRDVTIQLTSEFESIIAVADATRAEQVILNLLSNAIKYNKPGGSVNVQLSAIDKDTLHIAVADTGVGIDVEKTPDLFEYYNRLGAETSKVQGAGIGLALCKHLVEAMGGKIGASSEPGVGSTFWFTLQRASE